MGQGLGGIQLTRSTAAAHTAQHAALFPGLYARNNNGHARHATTKIMCEVARMEQLTKVEAIVHDLTFVDNAKVGGMQALLSRLAWNLLVVGRCCARACNMDVTHTHI